MLNSLPDPLAEPERLEPQNPWSLVDLIVFGVFFGLTVLLLPLGVIWLWRFVNPELKADQLTAVDLVLVQGLMNVVLVAFIAFLVKAFTDALSAKPFIGIGTTISRRVSCRAWRDVAVSVLIVSSLLPPSSPPPIEKLLSSSSAMWIFAIFGIGVALLFEEVIFRGFLFQVLWEICDRIAVPVTADSLCITSRSPALGQLGRRRADFCGGLYSLACS